MEAESVIVSLLSVYGYEWLHVRYTIVATFLMALSMMHMMFPAALSHLES